jgi:Tol biopolymer transport system component
VPAFFGGESRRQIPLDVPARLSVRLIRWVAQAIYVQIGEPPQQVSRLDLERGEVVPISAAWKFDGTVRGLDVRPDAGAIAFVLLRNRQEDLWVANLDGTGARRLTDDAFFEASPIWRGSGSTILYRSNRGGQVDLWEIDPRTTRTWALTSSQTHEQPESSSPDGRTITFQQSAADARIWGVDLASGRSRQLTAGALPDAAPTVSPDGTHVVFQRVQPNPSQNVPMMDARLHALDLTASGAGQEPRALVEGFGAVLSPDGASVAYQQRQAGSTRVKLLVTQLATGQTFAVSDSAMLPSFSPVLMEWVEQLHAWHPDGTEIFYVDHTDRATLRRRRLGSADAAVVVAAAEPDEFIRDVYPSADGRSLAFVVWKPGSAVLRLADLTAGGVRDLAAFPTGAIYARGWLPGDRGVVLLRRGADEVELGVYRLDLLIAPRSGGSAELAGAIDHAMVGSARFESSQSTLYVTRSLDGIHNVFAYPLASRLLRQVTDNAIAGVTYSGLRPPPAGGRTLILVRATQVRDVWLGDLVPADATRR